MKNFRELFIINEAKHKDGEIQSKDWDRMLDLVLTDKEGAKVAKSIKDKNKAVARYVAGTKLYYGDKKPLRGFGKYDDFAEKAIELGATEEEINILLQSTLIPSKIQDKYKSLKDKKLQSYSAGPITKLILKQGFDITYLKHNGNAISWVGRDAMSRNGRKWTIGHKAEITGFSNKISFEFDAITDEGGGPSYYFCQKLADGDLYFTTETEPVGQRAFLSWLKNKLEQFKK